MILRIIFTRPTQKHSHIYFGMRI